MAKAKNDKKLSMLLVVTLLAAIAIGGMLAYLQYETPTETNVMTMGNVKIDQKEDFAQRSPLYPAIGDLTEDGEGYWINANVVDKIVTVENTGESPAYVRTWFAFEYGDEASFAYLKANVNTEDWEWQWLDGTTKVAGMECKLAVAVYKNVLEPTKTTEASLKQVALLHTATNETVAVYGNDYKVLVISQAVQSAGFEATADKTVAEVALDTAFEEAVTENNPWADMVYVSNTSDFKAAIKNGGEINLGDAIEIDSIGAYDFTTGGYTGIAKATTINGGGNKIVRSTASNHALYVATTEAVVFDNVEFESVKGAPVLETRTNGANITVRNSTFNNLSSPSTGNTGMRVYAENVTIAFENCVFNNMPIVTNSSYPEGIKMVFNNCTFNWEGANCPAMVQLANYVVADLDFNNCKYTYNAPLTSTRINDFISTGTSTGAGTTINFNDFEMIGTAMEGKVWSVVSKGGVTSGKNVMVEATGTCTYTFNGSTVDFNTYLFK